MERLLKHISSETKLIASELASTWEMYTKFASEEVEMGKFADKWTQRERLVQDQQYYETAIGCQLALAAAEGLLGLSVLGVVAKSKSNSWKLAGVVLGLGLLLTSKAHIQDADYATVLLEKELGNSSN